VIQPVARYTIDDRIEALEEALGLIDQRRHALRVGMGADHFESTALPEFGGAGGG
jgi:hypothetical protein